MKKIAVLMTLVLMLCAMPLTAFAAGPVAPYAASNPPATPNWDLTATASSTLYPDGNDVTCSSIITGDTVVTSITIEQTLQKQGLFWIWAKPDNDSEWSTTVYKNGALFSNEKTGLESGKYRLKSVFTLKTDSGKSEKITIYSEIVVI